MEKGKNVKNTVKKTAKKVQNTAKKVNKENAKKALLSESMGRKHKYIILAFSSILIALCLYLGIIFVLNHTASVESTMDEITLEQYINASLSKSKEVVYVATKDSKINVDYEKIVVQVLSKRDTKVKFLDLGELDKNNQIIDFMNVLEITRESYSEPMLIIFEDEKIKDALIGSNDKSTLTNFLNKNRVD